MAAVSDLEAAQFQATGVLLKPAFFSTEETMAMRRSVDVLRDRGLMGNILVDAATENLQMAWLSHHSRLWQVLPWEPRVTEAVSRLLGAAVEVHYDQLFFKPALTGAGTAFHDDNAYFRIRDPLKGLGMCALDHPAALLPSSPPPADTPLGTQGSRWTTPPSRMARCTLHRGDLISPNLCT